MANPEELVQIKFQGATFSVPYLFVMSRKRTGDWKLLGEIEQTDSINILNHLVDVLAYPDPQR